MQTKILESGDEAQLEAFLLPHLDSSMFLLGNMRQAGIVYNGDRYSGTYAATINEGEITGVVAHVGRGNLICQAPPTMIGDLWQTAVDASGRPVQGAVGPAAQVAVIRDGLDITDRSVQLDTTEQLFTLWLDHLVVPQSLVSGHVTYRRIERHDLDLLTAWRVDYEIEDLSMEESPQLWERCRSAVGRSLNDGTAWLLEVDGHLVATSGFNAVIAEAVQVGGVWTPPELRGRGYARAIVAASLIDARDEGAKKGILFTGEDNIPAQKAYQAIGFELVGDYRLLILKTPISLLTERS